MDAITSACDVYKFDRLTPACFANELIERGTPGYWDLCKAITAPILSATFSVLLLFFMKDVNQPVQDMMSSLKPLLDHSLRLIHHKYEVIVLAHLDHSGHRGMLMSTWNIDNSPSCMVQYGHHSRSTLPLSSLSLVSHGIYC